MSIFSIFSRSRDKPENSMSLEEYLWMTNQTASGKSVTPTSALQLTAVYACVRILSESIAQLPLHLYRYEENGSKVKAVDEKLYYLMHDEPNREITSYTFIESMMMNLCLTGNAYAQIRRNGRGEVYDLWILRPDRMEVSRDSAGNLRYQYSMQADESPDGKDKFIQLSPESVLHIPGLGYDGLKGYSPLTIARNSIGSAMACDEYASRFWSNSATPSGVLEHPGKLSDPTRVRDSWRAAYGGPKNAGKVAVLEEGMKYVPISISPQEAQFLETRKYNIEEIARIYRIPPHMLADLEKSSFSNIEHQGLEFVQYTLTPWLRRWEQYLAKALLPAEQKQTHFFKFNVDGLLRGDYSSRMNGYAVARQNGWMSTNDIRELENMNRIPAEEGGDLYLVNGSMTKLADAGAAYNFTTEGGTNE